MSKARDIADLGSNDVLDTSSSGIDVTGSVTSDGVTVGDDQKINLHGGVDSYDDLLRDTSGNATIIRARNDVRVNIDSNSDSADYATFVVGYDGLDTTTKKALEVKEGGDISFYDGTGNNTKFFWDASEKRLGIKTSTPEEILDLSDTFPQNLKLGLRGYLGQTNSTSGTLLGHSIKAKTDSPTGEELVVTETNSGGGAPSAIYMSSGDIKFHTASAGTAGDTFDSERMRINSIGRVGIATDSPARTLDVNGDAAVVGKLKINESGTDGYAIIEGPGNRSLYIDIDSNDDSDFFAVRDNRDGSVRFKVQSGGDVSIGTTSIISSKLRVYSDSASRSAIHAQHATGSASGTNNNTGLHVQTPKNTVSMFIGDTESTSAYGSNDYSGDIRFNGSNVAWGDITYYPNGYNAGGHFRFTTNGSVVAATPNASIGVGSILLGGTGDANRLDDYEEGENFNLYEVNGQAPNMTTNRSNYTKIGNLVYVRASVNVGSTTNGNPFNTNLPFASANTSYYAGGGYVTFTDLGSTYGDNLRVNIENGGTNTIFTYGASGSNLTCAQASGKRIDFIVIYRTY
jgi:hypothetical protein